LSKEIHVLKPQKKRAEHSQNEHPDCQIMNILNQLFIIMYPLIFNKFTVLLNKSEFSKLHTENSQLHLKAYKK